MSTLYIIDLDNTLADASRRFKKVGKEPSRKNIARYFAWVDAVQNEKSLLADKPIPGMVSLVRSLIDISRIKPQQVLDVMGLTSREERWTTVTYDWLSRYDLHYMNVEFRPDYDYTEAHLLKEKQIKRALKRSKEVKEVVVIDDDPSGKLAKVCRKNGWTFLKCFGG